ncbi:MAG: sulfurtransferase TusA family protein [Synergistes sp.]|nr:sulfurtransferase TusA family protein [Synergistes sp.]
MLDARGLSCPQPVLMLKKAMADNGDKYEIIVDNVTAKENITRFAVNSGYNVSVTEQNDDYVLSVARKK